MNHEKPTLLSLMTFAFLVVVTTFNSIGQVELKGFELGAKCQGDTVSYNSLGEIPGALYVHTLSDSTIFSISFKPLNEKQRPNLLSTDDIYTLKRGLEIKFDIIMSKNELDEGYYYIYESDKVQYLILINSKEAIKTLINNKNRPSYTVNVQLTNLDLLRQYEDEKRAKAYKDF